jgi:predicted neutral ceramidase superfamily lipid hydrolase
LYADTKSSFLSVDTNNNLAAHYNNSQNFIISLLGLSFLDRDFFNNILDFKIFYVCLFIFSFYKILKIKNNLFINFTLISLLILLFISSEISSNLFDYLKIYIFEIKLFTLFRSPQNLLFLYPLFHSIIFYFVFLNYRKTIQFLLICTFLYPWILEGDLGHNKLKMSPKKVGFVDFVKKDQDYIDTLIYLNKNYSYNSIIFYPYTSSPLF